MDDSMASSDFFEREHTIKCGGTDCTDVNNRASRGSNTLLTVDVYHQLLVSGTYGRVEASQSFKTTSKRYWRSRTCEKEAIPPYEDTSSRCGSVRVCGENDVQSRYDGKNIISTVSFLPSKVAERTINIEKKSQGMIFT